jgi:hypothetical protein
MCSSVGEEHFVWMLLLLLCPRAARAPPISTPISTPHLLRRPLGTKEATEGQGGCCGDLLVLLLLLDDLLRCRLAKQAEGRHRRGGLRAAD